MARCVILSACPVGAELAGLLRPDDYLIACDAGYRSCGVLGRRPDAVVGDFDSAPRPDVPADEKLVVLPHVKDDTDTEYAAQLASRRGFTGRADAGLPGGPPAGAHPGQSRHRLGLEQRGVRAAIQDERSRITFLLPGQTRTYPKGDYFYLSVFPMEGKASGVNIRGAFYELTDADLSAAYPLGSATSTPPAPTPSPCR